MPFLRLSNEGPVMRTFFVLVKCALGKSYEVANDLVDNAEPCPYVYSISGDFDLICQFNVPSETDIGRFVNSQIHKIPGIANTKTLIAFNVFASDRGLPDG